MHAAGFVGLARSTCDARRGRHAHLASALGRGGRAEAPAPCEPRPPRRRFLPPPPRARASLVGVEPAGRAAHRRLSCLRNLLAARSCRALARLVDFELALTRIRARERARRRHRGDAGFFARRIPPRLHARRVEPPAARAGERSPADAMQPRAAASERAPQAAASPRARRRCRRRRVGDGRHRLGCAVVAQRRGCDAADARHRAVAARAFRPSAMTVPRGLRRATRMSAPVSAALSRRCPRARAARAPTGDGAIFAPAPGRPGRASTAARVTRGGTVAPSRAPTAPRLPHFAAAWPLPACARRARPLLRAPRRCARRSVNFEVLGADGESPRDRRRRRRRRTALARSAARRASGVERRHCAWAAALCGAPRRRRRPHHVRRRSRVATGALAARRFACARAPGAVLARGSTPASGARRAPRRAGRRRRRRRLAPARRAQSAARMRRPRPQSRTRVRGRGRLSERESVAARGLAVRELRGARRAVLSASMCVCACARRRFRADARSRAARRARRARRPRRASPPHAVRSLDGACSETGAPPTAERLRTCAARRNAAVAGGRSDCRRPGRRARRRASRRRPHHRRGRRRLHRLCRRHAAPAKQGRGAPRRARRATGDGARRAPPASA